MTREEAFDIAESEGQTVTFFEGYDAAIRGLASVTGDYQLRVVYSRDGIRDCLMQGGIASMEEAEEFIDYNVTSLHTESAPIIMREEI